MICCRHTAHSSCRPRRRSGELQLPRCPRVDVAPQRHVQCCPLSGCQSLGLSVHSTGAPVSPGTPPRESPEAPAPRAANLRRKGRSRAPLESTIARYAYQPLTSYPLQREHLARPLQRPAACARIAQGRVDPRDDWWLPKRSLKGLVIRCDAHSRSSRRSGVAAGDPDASSLGICCPATTCVGLTGRRHRPTAPRNARRPRGSRGGRAARSVDAGHPQPLAPRAGQA